jgi:hypothetical protein
MPRRIFTGEQEDQLVEKMGWEFIDEALCDCDEDFRFDALEFYEEIGYNLEERSAVDSEAQHSLEGITLLKASAPFVHEFRMYDGLALRRPALKRKCTVSKERQEEFILHVKSFMEKFPHDRIVNIDETNCQAVTPGIWTWATKGGESV